MRIAFAICRRCERRPTDVSEVERNMMWKGYKRGMEITFCVFVLKEYPVP